MYEILIGDRAEKELRKLPRDVLYSVDAVIEALAQEPRPPGCRKIRDVPNGWRVKVRRDHRVLYTIDDQSRTVYIYHVGRRAKDTYR